MDDKFKKMLASLTSSAKKKDTKKDKLIYDEQVKVLSLINEQRENMKRLVRVFRSLNAVLRHPISVEYFEEPSRVYNLVIGPAICPTIFSSYIPERDDLNRKSSKIFDKDVIKERGKDKAGSDNVKIIPAIGSSAKEMDKWASTFGASVAALELYESSQKRLMELEGSNADEDEDEVEDIINCCQINLYTLLFYFYKECGELSNYFAPTENDHFTSPFLINDCVWSPFLRPKFFIAIFNYYCKLCEDAKIKSVLVEQGFPSNSEVRYNFSRTLNNIGNWPDLFKAIEQWMEKLDVFTEALMDVIVEAMDSQVEPYFVIKGK